MIIDHIKKYQSAYVKLWSNDGMDIDDLRQEMDAIDKLTCSQITASLSDKADEIIKDFKEYGTNAKNISNKIRVLEEGILEAIFLKSPLG